MDVELDIRKLSEAYCIENLIPCKRQFTHQELEPYLLRIRQAARDVAEAT